MFSRLKRANEYEVRNYFIEELNLTSSQTARLVDHDIIRFSPFTFYKKKYKEEVSFWWRFTVIFIPIYILLVWICLLLSFIINGKWGASQKFIDRFHSVWMGKVNVDL